MNNAGVFNWIREGVRRAVLLGFSDAIEQVGSADDKDALHPQLESLLREPPKRLTNESRPAEPALGRGERKRLGRSLGQIQSSGSSGSTDD